jgi:ribosomal protein L16 Arg81 hydroxylase
MFRSVLPEGTILASGQAMTHPGAMISFGMTGRDFQAQCFEKRVHLQRAAVASGLYSWADLDAVLAQIEPGEPFVKLYNRGAVAAEAYTRESIGLGTVRRRLDKVRFYAQLRGGATLVLNRFEEHAPLARRLCLEVARHAGQPTTSNAYVSFGGRGTFGRHWDTHDVFALQLIGRKRWQVYAPTFPLPLSHQTSDGAQPDLTAAPVLDCTLETGDMLYVPRGWWHQTLPLEEGSFHLSVGVYAPTMCDYLMWFCSRHLPMQEFARRAFTPAASDAELHELLRELGRAALDPARRAEFQFELAARERSSSALNLGLFVDPAATPLGPDSHVSLATYCASPLANGAMLVNGALLSLDPVSASVVEVLADGALSFSALCARLAQVPVHAVHRAVLDLAQHDVVTIVTGHGLRATGDGQIKNGLTR